MITSSSGMCDCGDPNSWSVDGFCKFHKGPGEDPLKPLSPQLLDMTRRVFGGVIKTLVEYVKELAGKEKNNAIMNDCLSLLKSIQKYSDVSPAIKRVIYEKLKEEIDSQSVLDIILERTNEVPKEVADGLTKFYTSLLSDQKFKEYFARIFVRRYSMLLLPALEKEKLRLPVICMCFNVLKLTYKQRYNYSQFHR